jgi:hypothetical protein
MLRHYERLPAGGMAFLQAALLYTTTDGHRRVRVHTLALPVASSLGSVFRGADLDTTLQVRSLHATHSYVTAYGGISRGSLPQWGEQHLG